MSAAASAIASTSGELPQPEQPAAPALDPRRRKCCERLERHAGRGGVPIALSVPAQPDAGAFPGSGKRPCAPCRAVATAMTGSIKGVAAPKNRRPARARFMPAELRERFGPARPQGGVLLAQGVQAQPAFSGGSGKLPVRAVSAVPAAMAGSTRASYDSQNRPRTRSINCRRKLRERFGRHAREAAFSLRKAFLRSQTRAFSGGSGKLPSTKGERRQVELVPRTRPTHAGGKPASASAARPRGVALVAYGVRA